MLRSPSEIGCRIFGVLENVLQLVGNQGALLIKSEGNFRAFCPSNLQNRA
jgi:hypothetical protein